ncbi:glycosyltransferase [Streptomyces sannanensis]|uniref:Glycosyltransferase n=1 Tax=Streptomyces sannanensis TaxID=285536 RepID=A0ABP6SBK1_9ACTN
MTVLHISRPVDGGVARVVADLVEAQTRGGVRVAVACPEGGTLAAAAAARGAEVHPWRAGRAPGLSVVHETRQLARLVRRIAPDLVHAHSAKAGLAARLALRGRVPTVYQPHAWSFEAVEGLTARAARGWERYAARWTARVICVSEAERRTGERAGIDACWTVVHNGVDLGHFRPLDSARARAALPLTAGLPRSAPLVVCVGRLCRQKGQDVLLRAWPRVTDRMPRARLVLVGDGPDAGRLRAAAGPSVLFAGAVPDTAPWYRAADLVVLPSRWEGMALAPLEAMACGRAVVVSDVDGARESLPPGHAPICLTPPGDHLALAGVLTELLLNTPLRATLGRRARQHVLTTHDVRQTAGAVADVYRELAAVPHPECRERIHQ